MTNEKPRFKGRDVPSKDVYDELQNKDHVVMEVSKNHWYSLWRGSALIPVPVPCPHDHADPSAACIAAVKYPLSYGFTAMQAGRRSMEEFSRRGKDFVDRATSEALGG